MATTMKVKTYSQPAQAGIDTGAEPIKEQLVDGAAAIASLTDSSGGTANDTVQAIGGTYSQAEVANNFADVTAKINLILAALRNAGIIQS